MGYYIETEVVKEKAEWLRLNLGGIALTGKPNHVGPEYVPVCVVDNGSFEAAAIAFNEKEADEFDDKDDKRKREWLIIRREDAVRMCPHVEGKIEW